HSKQSTAMHAPRRLTALVLGAAATIVLGTARGQVPPSGSPSGASSAAKTSLATTAKTAALPDLPAQVFADPQPTKGQPGAPDPAEAKKQEHLQKIRQLAFDR